MYSTLARSLIDWTLVQTSIRQSRLPRMNQIGMLREELEMIDAILFMSSTDKNWLLFPYAS
jgi:hypothetical protein